MTKVLVNIDVKDLVLATRFYTEAFDLKLGRSFGDDGIELWSENAAIYLLVKAEGTAPFQKAREHRRYDRHWTPVHLDFVVDDIEEAWLRSKKAGAVFAADAKIRDHKWGRIIGFSDPFGNGVCLIEFLGRGYDEITNPSGN